MAGGRTSCGDAAGRGGRGDGQGDVAAGVAALFPRAAGRRAGGVAAWVGASGFATGAGAPMSDEDRALAARFKPMWEAYLADRSCPMPPTPDSWKPALATAPEAARRWEECWQGWNRHGRQGRHKPPHFTDLVQQRRQFDEQLSNALEELARPHRAPVQ